MVHLIYVSSATRVMSEEDLEAILEKSRVKNASLGITGMLLYATGNFIQVLEGEKEAVDELYATIEKDERHRDCMLLLEEEITERNFPAWSMGFRHLHELEPMEGYTEFMRQPLGFEAFAKHKDIIVELLYQFKQNNR